MKFTVAGLKSLGRRPRVHPNGFVQFDVEPGILRLNVWPAEPIPGHPGRIHPIHSHSFDIRSRIIAGALTNDVYAFEPSEYGNYVLHVATRTNAHDSVLAPLEKNFWGQPVPSMGYMVCIGSRTYRPGESYTLDRKLFHDSIAKGLTATLMTLEKPDKFYAPMVAVPMDVVPMNDYSREAYDEGMLWDIIAQVL